MSLFSHLFLVLLLMAVFGSCNSKRQEGWPEESSHHCFDAQQPLVCLSGRKGAAEARELGYEAKIFDSQNNTALEADHFENAIVSGYDAILLNPTDSDGSIVNVSKAKKAGIPVFCMDREINDPEGYVSDPVRQLLGLCGAGVDFAKNLNKKGNYVEILGMVGDNNTWNRSKGFHSVVDRYPGLKMVAQQNADFDRNKAMEVLESVLQAHPDIDAVFCGNDAMAMGAYQALVAAGKANEVSVYGFDGADDVLNSIQDDKIKATGLQSPQTMAKTAAQFADAYFKGKRDFAQRVPVAVELVTQQNISDYIARSQQ